jgi:sugar (pentulose or hexulose) kinase
MNWGVHMEKDKNLIKQQILSGGTALGIELGSTRIKSVLIDKNNQPIASGGHDWENRYMDNVWTYSLDEVWEGLQASYRDLCENVKKQYDVELETIGAIGISGMMHGYLVFDKNRELLTPFRTWRNTMTAQASKELTDLFHYQIPQRWSIAHLYQAIMNGEEHVSEIDFMTTLAAYVHWKLTGEKVIGVGEASGMFPIDLATKNYQEEMLHKFDSLIAPNGFSWKLQDILPKVLVAGEHAGTLTEEGARLLDPTGTLKAGISFCPPEGDAGTGMTATNSVAVKTGNVSAGTSVFAMIVLEKELSKVYHEIDLVTTPSGDLVAMVHCNNCTSDLNAWVSIFGEFADAVGIKLNTNDLYGTLYRKALEGDADAGGLLAFNYLSGEHITGFSKGCPLFVRTPDSNFTLANFIRVNLMTSLAVLKTGLDILTEKEKVQIQDMYGHGGFFKTTGVGQRIMAAAMNVPVSVMETAGEGGSWGIAVLASYMLHKKPDESLSSFLNTHVFAGNAGSKLAPLSADVEGYEAFMKRYHAGLAIERAAVDTL